MTQPEAGQGAARGRSSASRAFEGLDGVAVVGLACAQAWMTVRWFPLMSGSSAQSGWYEWLMGLSCLVAMGVLVACAVLARLADRRIEGRLWKSFVLLWVVGGIVAVACSSLFADAVEGWVLATGVLTGVGSGLLLLTWVVECVRTGSIMSISLAFLLSSALLLLTSICSSLIESLMAVDVVLGAVLAGASSLLLFARGRSDGRSFNYSVKETDGTLHRFLVKVCAGSFLVGLANELVRFTHPSGPVLFFRGDSAYGAVVLILLLVNVGIVWQLASRRPSNFYFVCRGAIVLCVASALLLPYASDSSLLFSVSIAGRQCLQMLIWIIVFMLCRKHHFSPVALFGASCSVWYLGSFVGIFLHRASVAVGPSMNGFTTDFVSVLAVFLLVVAFVFLFSESDSDLVFGSATAAPVRKKAFRKGCDRLVREGRLTNREAEVLRLLAKGASVSHIEEKLYISASTVNTHMKHIYQKLGVHSRKELYDLVEQSSEMYAVGADEEPRGEQG